MVLQKLNVSFWLSVDLKNNQQLTSAMCTEKLLLVTDFFKLKETYINDDFHLPGCFIFICVINNIMKYSLIF